MLSRDTTTSCAGNGAGVTSRNPSRSSYRFPSSGNCKRSSSVKRGTSTELAMVCLREAQRVDERRADGLG
jgi:hypothetical protein